MSTNPLILEIKGNSLDDGPGIRSVIFFKGCPLSCVWCHNPESKRSSVEISFDPGECIGFNACIGACSEKALNRKNDYFIDRLKCNLCFKCVEVCPSGAMSIVGREMAVDEIVEKIIKDKPFYDTSGGGVTLYGGEPTINMEFTSKLIQEFKKNDIHVLVETCGQFNYDNFMKLIYPHTDMIYYDIKIIDEAEHKKHCGVNNKKILENFSKLHEKYLAGGVEILPRTPLIPDITDTVKNMEDIARFYTSNKVKKTDLLSYNPLWHEKNSKIGIENEFSNEEKMTKFIDNEKVRSCRKVLTDAGIILK